MSTPVHTTTYTVKGMTCEHCVRSVTEEVTDVAGVTGVEVDLATGLLTVAGEGPIAPVKIVAAVQDAGYEVVNQP